MMKTVPLFKVYVALPIAAMLTLSGCGGGGGSASSGPTLADAQSANPSVVRAAAVLAAANLPRFGSVTQSSPAGNIAGVTGDTARASFDGRHVSVTVRRADGSSLTLNSALHRFNTESYARILPGYSYRGDALLTYTDTSLTVAAVYTNWNDTDPNDYLAGGYWTHLKGRINPLTVTSAEVGAFVDGPEIRGAPTLPGNGTATYSGRAGGLYAFQYGGALTGTAEIGEFDADTRLTANFSSNTISGCIGCNGGFTVTGVTSNESGSAETFSNVTVSGRLRLGAASFGDSGTFRASNLTMEFDGRTVTSSSGSWGGQFSNKLQAGEPRLAVGTAGVEWTESDGSRGGAVGAWFATQN